MQLSVHKNTIAVKQTALILALQKFGKPLKVTIIHDYLGINCKGYLYATSGSSGQNGIKTDTSAFRHTSRGYYDVVREGATGCDNTAIQSVASASNENWIEESVYRQKDRDNITSCAARRRTGQTNRCAPRYDRHTPA